MSAIHVRYTVTALLDLREKPDRDFHFRHAVAFLKVYVRRPDFIVVGE
jgi:hypothetical protein